MLIGMSIAWAGVMGTTIGVDRAFCLGIDAVSSE
jgi:hypothetical protein